MDLGGWTLAVAIVLTYIALRFIAIGAVLMYKAYAPLSVRGRCRFQPTCSTYMIICLKRYGLIIGIIKGLRRISRCRPPNGGIDYPYLFKKPKINLKNISSNSSR